MEVPRRAVPQIGESSDGDLDLRVLSVLQDSALRKMPTAFSVNLNMATIETPVFQQFEASIRGRAGLELHVDDGRLLLRRRHPQPGKKPDQEKDRNVNDNGSRKTGDGAVAVRAVTMNQGLTHRLIPMAPVIVSPGAT